MNGSIAYISSIIYTDLKSKIFQIILFAVSIILMNTYRKQRG